MADSGIFRINPLQSWQREAILKAAALLRDRFGNPPVDAQARIAHDGLLEVLDPARRTVRLQRELSEATRKAALTEKTERRARERRATDRRKANLGPPEGQADRRKGERRAGERRNRK
jgi:C4-dicarboxylate-specific signal transduction histidine kinase